MQESFDSFFKAIAKPFVFLGKKAGLSFLLGLLLAVLVYSSFRKMHGSFLNLIIDYSSFNEYWIEKTLLLLTVSLLLLLLFSKTPLKVISVPAVNTIACILLLLIIALNYKLLASIIGLILLILLLWKSHRGDAIDYDYTFNPYGDSRWASYHHISDAKLFEKTLENEDFGFLLGRTRDDEKSELIKFEGEGHILTIAKTGAGKGVSVVIPNLLTYKGSTIVIDPKGENFLKSYYHRETGFGNENQEIYLIDPFREVSKQVEREINKFKRIDENKLVGSKDDYIEYLKKLKAKCTTYGEDFYLKGLNPMQIINTLYEQGRHDEIYDEANVLADMLVVKTGQESDPHWNEKAKSFIRGAILFVVFSEIYEDEPKNLITVRHCIFHFFKGPTKVKKSEDVLEISLIGQDKSLDELYVVEDNLSIFLEECNNEEHAYYKYLKGVAGEVSLIAGDERNSVLSNVLRHTDFLDSPMVTESLTRNDCYLEDIKQTYKTIYLVLPANKLSSYNRLARLWISTVIQCVARDLDTNKNRVLFLLDEMAQLGYMEPLVQAVSLMRGYGMNMWMVFQDIPQIKGIYGEKWQTFVANSKVQQYFGITDSETAEYVSKLTGQTTMTLRSDTDSSGSSTGQGGGSTSKNQSQTISSAGKPLLYPDQVRRAPYQIIIADGVYPIRANRIKYFEDSHLIQCKSSPITQPKILKTTIT